MKERRIYLITLISLLIALLMLCGSVVAYMFRQSDTIKNDLVPSVVACDVVETFDGTDKSSVKVRNTGNIDAYIRIRLVSYWIDEHDNIVPKESFLPELNFDSNWIKGSNDTYYYNTPVSPGLFTGELLKSPITLTEEDGCKQVIEVFAEAIQSKPDNAVKNSWNVGLDSDGKIISVN